MMFKKILLTILDIFLIPEEKIKFNEIYLNKTSHYKKELKELYLDNVFVCLEYDENLKKYLKSFKFEYNKKLKFVFLEYLEKYWDIIIDKFNKEDIIVCWSPLYFINHIKRWYNQTYLLWELFASKFNLRFSKILFKKKYTKSQSKLERKDRLKNLWWVFQIKKKYKEKISWKIIILIDDVVSSWTTANEIAKILKENWAKDVVWLFLASGN
ncbi:MAG: phosphoribosyltransferase [uncultured bacterium (gcode 4)]|uniref:Phosphoribosyltransferase n=1 Tax=uncultured bacterium (gcode 4) TaxID=1234023 RepID=K2F6P2_9BACT|nr:MAG: phosphoribosyltransferase [uncultured bacterium (gcode 4)]